MADPRTDRDALALLSACIDSLDRWNAEPNESLVVRAVTRRLREVLAVLGRPGGAGRETAALEPAEKLALRVASAQLDSGEAPSPNVAAVCVMALARLAVLDPAPGLNDTPLGEALRDLFWRAVRYGETDDGDVRYYLFTKGTVHRLLGHAQGAGVNAAFRARDNDHLPDEAPGGGPADAIEALKEPRDD